MIDGAIARKTGSVTKLGARLDTLADFVFVLTCVGKILPLMHLPIWLWVWVISVAWIKIANAAVVLLRKKKILSIHSALNKITGLALFLLPPTLTFVPPVYSVATICVLATIAAIQEVCFVVKGQDVL